MEEKALIRNLLEVIFKAVILKMIKQFWKYYVALNLNRERYLSYDNNPTETISEY